MTTAIFGQVSRLGQGAYWRGLVLVTLAMLFSSTSGIFVRSLPELDPWTINAYRGGFMGLSLLVYLLVLYRRSMGALIAEAQPLAFMISAACFGGATSAYVVAVSLASSVASVSALSATAPIFAALVAWIFLRERTPTIVLAAAAMAFIGILVITCSEDRGAGNGILVTLLGLAVPFLMAAQTVVLKRFAATEMTPALVLGGMSVFLLVWLFHGLAVLGLKDLLLLAVMGFVQLGLSLVCFVRGAPHVPAVQSMLIAMGDVIFNPLWTWLVYGEQVPATVFFGGSLIMAAILMATILPRLRRR
ncbi:MAG TPA: DMT family transporter [Dongiaceae bacterium]|nr:DMT family transporter [Dongiaceae bacterium]